MKLIVDISDIEDRCRSFLLEKGELYIPMKRGPQLFVALANWSDVIHIMGHHKKKGVLTSKGIENLNKLKKFRNTVIHEYLPLLKNNEKDFPNGITTIICLVLKTLILARVHLRKSSQMQLFFMPW